MWNGIKTGFTLVVFMLLALFTSWIVGHAFNLMNNPSDFLVLIGVDLLLLMFLFWFILTWTSIRVFRNWWKSRKSTGKSMPGLSGILPEFEFPPFSPHPESRAVQGLRRDASVST